MIETKVRNGEAKIDFRNFTIIGPQSVAAGAAALAAGEQGRGWNFLELFYRNQGVENSGYADDEFLDAMAKAPGSRTSPSGTRTARARSHSRRSKRPAEEAQTARLHRHAVVCDRRARTATDSNPRHAQLAGELEEAIEEAELSLT